MASATGGVPPVTQNQAQAQINATNAAFRALVNALKTGRPISANLQAKVKAEFNKARNLKARAPEVVNPLLNKPPKTPEAAVGNALQHLRGRLSPGAVLNAAAYVGATNNVTRAKNRQVGRVLGMYRNPELREFWKSVNALLKNQTPANEAAFKKNILGPKARAAIQWVKNHPRLAALGTVVTGGALPVVAAVGAPLVNVGAAAGRGIGAGIQATYKAPGGLAKEIRGLRDAANTKTYLLESNKGAILKAALTNWAATTKTTGTNLGKARAMRAAYNGSNVNKKKQVLNAIQKAWPRGSRYKFNVSNTGTFMNALKNHFDPLTPANALAAFQARKFWANVANSNTNAMKKRAVAYWKQNNLTQNMVFSNRAATEAQLGAFWEPLQKSNFGTNSKNKNAFARYQTISNAWARKTAAEKRTTNQAALNRNAAITTLFGAKPNQLKAIRNILNGIGVNEVVGLNNAQRRALALAQRAPNAPKLNLKKNINQTQGLTAMNKQILKAYLKEFTAQTRVANTRTWIGKGLGVVPGVRDLLGAARNESKETTLTGSRKVQIPATLNQLLKEGNKGWAATNNTTNKMISTLLLKYPPAYYNWAPVIAKLRTHKAQTTAETTLKNNILKATTAAAVGAQGQEGYVPNGSTRFGIA